MRNQVLDTGVPEVKFRATELRHHQISSNPKKVAPNIAKPRDLYELSRHMRVGSKEP